MTTTERAVGTPSGERKEELGPLYRPHGLVVPLITPAVKVEYGDVLTDISSLTPLMKHVAASGNGAEAVFIAGGSGEYVNLPGRERRRLINSAVSRAQAHDLKVLVGVSAPRLSEMARFASLATDAGADGVVVNLLLGEGTPEDKLRWLAKATPLGITAYEIPENQHGIVLDPTRYGEWLRDHDQVVGIKVSTGVESVLMPWLDLAGPEFHVLPGSTTTGKFALEHGAAGYVFLTGNVYPEEFAWDRLMSEGRVNSEAMDIVIGLRRQFKDVAEIKEELHKKGIIRFSEMFPEK